MDNKLSGVFKKIEELDPPKELGKTILCRIGQERAREIRVEIFLSRIGFVGSFLVLFYAASVFGKAILESEFWYLVSLVFSDLSIIAQNWQEFTYSLLETMPVINLVAVLLPIFLSLLFFNSYLTLNHEKSYRFKKL